MLQEFLIEVNNKEVREDVYSILRTSYLTISDEFINFNSEKFEKNNVEQWPSSITLIFLIMKQINNYEEIFTNVAVQIYPDYLFRLLLDFCQLAP